MHQNNGFNLVPAPTSQATSNLTEFDRQSHHVGHQSSVEFNNQAIRKCASYALSSTDNMVQVSLTKTMVKYSNKKLYLFDQCSKENNFRVILLSQFTIMTLSVLINCTISLSNNILNNSVIFKLNYKMRNIQ